MSTRILSDKALFIIDGASVTAVPLDYLLNLTTVNGVRTAPFASSVTLDASQSSYWRLKLTGDTVLQAPTNGRDFQGLELQVTQDNIGGHSLTLGTGFTFCTDAPSNLFTLSTTALANDIIRFRYDALSLKWQVVSLIRGF